MTLSIHDLTRRSTCFREHSRWRQELSIHDLTRRSTYCKLIKSYDRALSIHDLTRRSTSFLVGMANYEDFQFTTSQGGRQEVQEIKVSHRTFNSRPHKEVDQTEELERHLVRSFNSRPHKEVDALHPEKNKNDYVFQFTTSQGGRLKLKETGKS